MIRDLARQGKSYTEICELTQSNYRTVKKYIAQENFSATITKETAKPTVLDPYKEEIRQLIDENAKNWYKQRLTAARIHSILQQRHPEYQVSYPSLQRYVHMYQRQIRLWINR